MSTVHLESLQAFQWSPQPAAEAIVQRIVREFLEHCPPAAALGEHMRTQTGTRFFDWIDSIALPQRGAGAEGARAGSVSAAALHDAGFQGQPGNAPSGAPATVFRNPQGIFPALLLGPQAETVIALKVDSVADFLAIYPLEVPIEGEPFAPLRRAVIARVGDTRLEVIERRGSDAFVVGPADPGRRVKAAEHLERFRRRRRDFSEAGASGAVGHGGEGDSEGFHHAAALVDAAIADIGVDATCAWFFAAEREFWQRRNRAAQVQKARQDRLGLGWGNHDHHTYRSSRIHFRDLMALFEKMGVQCRERFYAGREAGWGAQVMENPRAGIVVFADVDLAPEELLEDFAHNPLPPRNVLGTVGLWCGLHGEALLQAGMHHLECQFDFDALKQQLESEHQIGVMKPFTDFPFLRQAFTQGERWPVTPERLDRLLAAGLITPVQAEQFRTQGAIGSHLENLERNEGYKGFNQKGVSEIIAATDPRQHVAAT